MVIEHHMRHDCVELRLIKARRCFLVLAARRSSRFGRLGLLRWRLLVFGVVSIGGSNVVFVIFTLLACSISGG